MARHVWTVLCDRALIDKNSQKISLIDTVEQLVVLDEDRKTRNLGADDNVAIRTALVLVSYFWRSDPEQPETSHLRVMVVDPHGKRIPPSSDSLVPLEEHQRVRCIIKVGSFPLRGEGTYNFHVQTRPNEGSRWKTVARIPLILNFADSIAEMPS